MNPEVQKAIETRDALQSLLWQFKLLNQCYLIEISVYDLMHNNDYESKAGLRLRDRDMWSNPIEMDLETLMQRIQQFTGVEIKYEIHKEFAYPICFFDLKYLHRLYDAVYPLARIYA